MSVLLPPFLSRHSYLIVLILMLVFAALWVNKAHWSGDFFTHAAAVNELMERPVHPSHPFIVSEQTHPFFSPYTLIVAFLASAAGFSAMTALGFAGLMNLLLFMACFYYFVGCLFQKYRAYCASASLLFVLFLWGKEPYFWSGFSHFISFWTVLPYPSTFCLSLVFLLAGSLMRIKKPGAPLWILIILLSGTTLLIHPNTWLCLWPLVFGARFFLHGSPFWKSLSFTMVTIGSGLLLACLWPYFSFSFLVLNPDPLYHQQSLALYEHPVKTLWPFLLIVPAFILCKRTAHSKLLAFGALMLFLVYCLSFVTQLYGCGRTIAMAMILVQVHVIYTMHQAGYNKIGQKIFSVMVSLALLVCICINWLPIKDQARIAFTGKQINYYSRYAFVSGFAEQGDCVMAPEVPSMILPAFGVRVVGNQFPLYGIIDAAERRLAITDFYSGDNSLLHKDELLTKFNCRFFMITDDNLSALRDAFLLGTPVYDSAGVKLFERRGESEKM